MATLTKAERIAMKSADAFFDIYKQSIEAFNDLESMWRKNCVRKSAVKRRAFGHIRALRHLLDDLDRRIACNEWGGDDENDDDMLDDLFKDLPE